MSTRLNTAKEPTAAELDEMHAFYRDKGGERRRAPHLLYRNSACPHIGCDQQMQGIDFRLENYGKDVHDPPVRVWWDDNGFADCCPLCRGWVHFTIRGKSAIADEEAGALPNRREDWSSVALIS